MGQSSSISRGPGQRYGQGSAQRMSLTTDVSHEAALSPTQNLDQMAFSTSSAAFLTRTQISSRTDASGNATNSNEETHHDQVIYESEARPLRSMGDLRMPEAPINDISAAPLPRPRSMLSRVASSIHHRYSTISIDRGSENEMMWDNSMTWEERNRQTFQPRRSFSIRNVQQRLSGFSHIGRTPPHTQNLRSRTNRFSISRPIPHQDDSSLSPEFGLADALRRAPVPSSQLDQITEHDNSVTQRPIRRSRMSRFRQSISGPIDLLRNSFHGTHTQLRSQDRTERANTTDESDYLIPSDPTRAAGADMDEHTDHPAEVLENISEVQHEALPGLPAVELPASGRARSSTSNDNIGQPTRRRNASTPPRSAIPSLLRARSSRMIRRDDEMPLSTILQLAATAIAAQLSGNADALANLESVGDDQLDGNLNTFVEELNNAPGAPGTARDANTPPLNFWRVYRFDNGAETHSRRDSTSSDDPRTVTVVVVGVRSVSSTTAMREHVNASPGLDTLLDLPRLRSNTLQGSDRRYHRMSRRQLTNRHGPTGFTDLRSNREIADIVDFGPQAWNTPQAESPPGPYPPPSTPADRLSLSPVSPQSSLLAAVAGNETSRLSLSSWIRRRSVLASSSSSSSPPSHQEFEADDASSSEEMSNTTNQPQTPVRRRRSDSEAARHPHLRRDDPRRHGIIGAPHDREDAAPLGRSWLIYVIGTNLSEDNPLLDMPDLFDVNGNSYEDMLRLQELIGPVKPPTATEADLRAAGGIFVIKVRKANGVLLAESSTSPDSIEVPTDSTCIICQEGYDLKQEIRKLKCPHVFHRACVDPWLTGSKNSCPLCRSKGVDSRRSSSRNDNIHDVDIGRAI